MISVTFKRDGLLSPESVDALAVGIEREFSLEAGGIAQWLAAQVAFDGVTEQNASTKYQSALVLSAPVKDGVISENDARRLARSLDEASRYIHVSARDVRDNEPGDSLDGLAKLQLRNEEIERKVKDLEDRCDALAADASEEVSSANAREREWRDRHVDCARWLRAYHLALSTIVEALRGGPHSPRTVHADPFPNKRCSITDGVGRRYSGGTLLAAALDLLESPADVAGSIQDALAVAMDVADRRKAPRGVEGS